MKKYLMLFLNTLSLILASTLVLVLICQALDVINTPAPSILGFLNGLFINFAYVSPRLKELRDEKRPDDSK